MTPTFHSPSAGFWKDKRVFVTGHTGFKGAWLSYWLHHLGARVGGYALPPDARPNLFEPLGLAQRMDSHFGDVRDLATLQTQMKKFRPDIVLHLAAQALVRPSYEDPVGTYATNVMGTVNVLEAARQTGSARAIVVVTTDKCYENREWAWGYRENEPMGGYDPYSSSKGCAELVTSAYRRSFFSGAGIASARAGNVIGGGDWSVDRLIPDCIRSLQKNQPIPVRNPASTRPWQHVLEPLGGYLRLAEKLWDEPARMAQAFNFGPALSDARPVSWIADRMVALWGGGARWENRQEPGAPHEANYLKLDCSLAKSELGWEPRTDLTKALEWVVEWYREVGPDGLGSRVETLTRKQIEEFEKLA
ncbi:MAG: CDP-glucose 4,6-dehydratase [Bacteriovoracia bacterium]